MILAIAADLVEQLFALDPNERLGSAAKGGYDALKAHPWFEGVDFVNLESSVKPEMTETEVLAKDICEVRQ